MKQQIAIKKEKKKERKRGDLLSKKSKRRKKERNSERKKAWIDIKKKKKQRKKERKCVNKQSSSIRCRKLDAHTLLDIAIPTKYKLLPRRLARVIIEENNFSDRKIHHPNRSKSEIKIKQKTE